MTDVNEARVRIRHARAIQDALLWQGIEVEYADIVACLKEADIAANRKKD